MALMRTVREVSFGRGCAAGRRGFQRAFGFFDGFLPFFGFDFPFEFFDPGEVLVLLVMVVMMLDGFVDRSNLPGLADGFGLGAAPASADCRGDGNA